MATVNFNKKTIVKLLKKILSNRELEDRISMMGSEVDSIDDNMIVADILANRPDMLSEEGLARQLNGFTSGEKGLKSYHAKKSNYSAVIDKNTRDIRPYALCAVVRGLKLSEDRVKSLMQLQEKLHITYARKRKLAAIGLHDISTVEFPVKYTTVKEDFSFIPLGYEQELNIKEVLRVHQKGIEYADLLPKKKYPVWLDAKENVLSLPPIINSKMTAVTEKTRDVLVDVTGWDERVVENILNIVVCTLSDMGGDIYSVEINGKEYPGLNAKHMKIDYTYINKILGVSLPHDQIDMLLHKMRFGTEDGKALIPSYRVDIMHQIDLAEEVAIAYGYENFKPEIPQISTIGGESRISKIKGALGDLMVGLGYMECITYSLSNKDMLLKKMQRDYRLVKTRNSVNENYDSMRNSVLPSLLKVLSENKHHPYPQKLYETGKIFVKEKNVRESWSLCAVTSHSNSDFTVIKSSLEAIFRNLDRKIKLRAIDDSTFMKGRCAEIDLDGKVIGIIGEIHPQVLNNFELESPVAAFEIDVTSLLSS